MEAHQQAATNGHAPFPAERIGSSPELSELRVAYQRQAHVIDTLTAAVSRLRTGVTALKADNSDLRGELDRLRGLHRARGAASSSALAEVADIRLGVDVDAPVVARAVLVSAFGVDPLSWTLECLGRKARAGRMSRCREPDLRIRRSSAARRLS
jgi:hypothetical protein